MVSTGQIFSTNSAVGAPSWGELLSSAVIVKTVAAEAMLLMSALKKCV